MKGKIFNAQESKLQFANEFFHSASGHYMAGFNARVLGNPLYSTASFQIDHYSVVPSLEAGWIRADKMAKDGKIFFVNEGKEIKTMKDGDAWCCIGKDFTDLQSSDDYEFGDTREEAVKNYMKKFEVINN